MGNKNYVCALFMDLVKGFDSMRHPLLIIRRYAYDVSMDVVSRLLIISQTENQRHIQLEVRRLIWLKVFHEGSGRDPLLPKMIFTFAITPMIIEL